MKRIGWLPKVDPFFAFVAYPVSRVRNFHGWAKQLNLFKSGNDRTEHTRRKQRIMTRIYLLLLTGMIFPQQKSLSFLK